jgi:hypothetical protein
MTRSVQRLHLQYDEQCTTKYIVQKAEISPIKEIDPFHSLYLHQLKGEQQCGEEKHI